MEPGLRTRVLTAVTLGLVFVSGGVTGYAVAAREGDAAEPPPPARRSFVYEQFNPTDVQQVQIDSLLQLNRQAMAKLFAEMEEINQRYQASSDSITMATGDAISQVFPPDVAVEYRKRLAERRVEWQRAREEAERERGGRR